MARHVLVPVGSIGGSYRCPTLPGVYVWRHPWDLRSAGANREAKAKPWLLVWKDWMSTEHKLRFATLREVRAHLNGG